MVAGLGITALEGLISDVLQLQGNDFHSLIETRVLLELNSAKLAALRRTDDDIMAIARALDAYEKAVSAGKSAVEEDLLFHLQIAEASKNSVLKSLMMIVTPDILTFFKENDVCGGERPTRALEEHHKILDYINNRDVENAEASMRSHLSDISEFTTGNGKVQ